MTTENTTPVQPVAEQGPINATPPIASNEVRGQNVVAAHVDDRNEGFKQIYGKDNAAKFKFNARPKFIYIDKTSKRPGRKMRSVFAELDVEVKRQTEGTKVTCKSGCNACCNRLVLVTFPEAILIAEKLLTSELNPKIGTYAEESLERVVAMDDPAFKQNIAAASEAYFKATKPCIFLNEGGKCDVYDVRPAMCRYHMVTSDPADCAKDAGVRVPIKGMNKVPNEASKVCNQTKIPYLVAPISVAVMWALKLLTEGPKEFSNSLNTATDQLSPKFWATLLNS